MESYSEWHPPFSIRPELEALIKSIPEKYLAGLGCIVLTDTGSLNRSLRRKKVRHRGRKRARIEANGSYQPAWPGHLAHIELFVDNILAQYSRSALRFSLLRKMALAHTLFHEVGHHIHKTKIREFRDNEGAVDEWAHQLTRRYFGRKYWWLSKLIQIGSKH